MRQPARPVSRTAALTQRTWRWQAFVWPLIIAAIFLLTSCAANPKNIRIDSAAAPVFLGEQCTAPGEDVLASIVRVATAEGNDGSGVVVSKNQVLTAAHVLEDSDKLLVYVDGEYKRARRVATDLEHDLALLTVDTGSLEPINLADSTLATKEAVWAIGYPLALDQRTTEGYLRQSNGYKIYTSARIDAGNSGGGLLRCRDGQHQLAGIVSSYGAYWLDGELIALHDLSISVSAPTIETFIASTSLGL